MRASISRILVTFCVALHLVGAQEEEDVTYHADLEGPSTRIVNGIDAPVDRYPYYVALYDKNDNFRCGGTLIAPNIVLSAAHCQSRLDYVLVGLYDSTTVGTAKDTSERFNIAGRHPNPKWIFEEYSFDQMILVLDGASDNQPIKINLDPDFPTSNTTMDRNATLIGFGKTSTGVQDVVPTLQETNLTVLDNEECAIVEDEENESFPFLDRITDDMICVDSASDTVNTGQCSGDSGGPYLFKGDNDTPKSDLQFGLVSWSYGAGCQAAYPGVGARTSEVDWIRYTVCQYAVPPPDYLDCGIDGSNITFSPAPTFAPDDPTPAPTISPAPTGPLVTITLSFYFDDHPHETFWSIRDANGYILLERPPYYYPRDIELVRESLLVSPGDYILTVEDTHGDGIRSDNEIAYDIILTNDATGDKFKLLERPGNFRIKRTETFLVPSVANYPTEAPSASPSQSFAPTEKMLEVYLTLDFDDWHEELGWSIFDANDPSQVYAAVEPGEYKEGDTITEEILLPYPGGVYTLLVEDNFGDGIREPTDGYFLWTKDPPTGDQIVIVAGAGDFEFEMEHNFTLPELTSGSGSNETISVVPELDLPEQPPVDVAIEKKSHIDNDKNP